MLVNKKPLWRIINYSGDMLDEEMILKRVQLC